MAVKVLPPDYSADPDRLRRFEQEAKAAGALNHPNLATVFDTGEHEGNPYVVFELLEGVTLRQRLGSGSLPFRKAADYAGSELVVALVDELLCPFKVRNQLTKGRNGRGPDLSVWQHRKSNANYGDGLLSGHPRQPPSDP